MKENVEIILAVVAFLLACIALFRVAIRLGLGLQFRKIWIISPSEHLSSVKDIITDAGIFKKVDYIPPDDLKKKNEAKHKLKRKSMLVFRYPSSTPETNRLLELVLESKDKSAGLIVFSPPPPNGIKPPELMTKASDTENTIVVNAKGRLLNDLLNLMMTTSLQRKDPLARILGR